MSQPTGLKFCLLPVCPSCLPIFGSVPVLISSLSNYKLITFIVSTCQPLVICPIFVHVLWVLVCWLLLMLCVCVCCVVCVCVCVCVCVVCVCVWCVWCVCVCVCVVCVCGCVCGVVCVCVWCVRARVLCVCACVWCVCARVCVRARAELPHCESY